MPVVEHLRRHVVQGSDQRAPALYRHVLELLGHVISEVDHAIRIRFLTLLLGSRFLLVLEGWLVLFFSIAKVDLAKNKAVSKSAEGLPS